MRLGLVPCVYHGNILLAAHWQSWASKCMKTIINLFSVNGIHQNWKLLLAVIIQMCKVMFAPVLYFFGISLRYCFLNRLYHISLTIVAMENYHLNKLLIYTDVLEIWPYKLGLRELLSFLWDFVVIIWWAKQWLCVWVIYLFLEIGLVEFLLAQFYSLVLFALF